MSDATNPIDGLRQVIREQNFECAALRREIETLREKIGKRARRRKKAVKRRAGAKVGE